LLRVRTIALQLQIETIKFKIGIIRRNLFSFTPGWVAMEHQITKKHGDVIYLWTGETWVNARDYSIPSTSLEAELNKQLSEEEWLLSGRIPPGGTLEQCAQWHTKLAEMGGPVWHVFCWNCGRFVPPPTPAYKCDQCMMTSIPNRRFCQFCGTRLSYSLERCRRCKRSPGGDL
jgi:hypothetical protein